MSLLHEAANGRACANNTSLTDLSNVCSTERVRWDGLKSGVDDGALPDLQRLGFVRSVRTPQFEGITFHEILCKSALNKVPDAANLPFRFTVNGFRGCSHACRYCFARPTHEYLDFDCGDDFDTQLVVKVNVADVLRRELSRGVVDARDRRTWHKHRSLSAR